ncbi:cytidylyltransferase domain-containing protein [Desulfocurvus vexinensis]|uniref:acylneuraminate cytidylyltransferase family protein n=1 Tax=Desulfocurvus vexinensis TaxID=399548 RepID=UPI0004B53CFB|nr:acylneuraminate cytidylyltransferase family protein [Desulfocurvus vexinensis]
MTGLRLALIPARAGSRRLPGKNMLPLGGKPLTAWTIEAVLASGAFDTVVVSSDDPAVLELARGYAGVRAMERPAELASDQATTSQVLTQVLDALGARAGLCGLFLPTAPLRGAGHIREAVALLAPGVDAVVAVTAFPAPVAFGVELRGGLLDIPEGSPLRQGRTRSQQHPTLYRPNGALYLSRIEAWRRWGGFYGGAVAGYVMDKCASVDVDEEDDYLMARALFALGAAGAPGRAGG